MITSNDGSNPYQDETQLREFSTGEKSQRVSGRMKYVMFGYPVDTLDWKYFPIMFPEELTHSAVAEGIMHMKMPCDGGWVHPRPVSAGFIDPDRVLGWLAHGESESLGLKMHPEDGTIINSFRYTQGTGFSRRGATPPRKG